MLLCSTVQSPYLILLAPPCLQADTPPCRVKFCNSALFCSGVPPFFLFKFQSSGIFIFLSRVRNYIYMNHTQADIKGRRQGIRKHYLGHNRDMTKGEGHLIKTKSPFAQAGSIYVVHFHSHLFLGELVLHFFFFFMLCMWLLFLACSTFSPRTTILD